MLEVMMKTNKAKRMFEGTSIGVGDIIFICKRRCILLAKTHAGIEYCKECALNNEIKCSYFPCADFYPKEIKGGL